MSKPNASNPPTWVHALVARVDAEQKIIADVLANPTDECLTAWPGARSNVPLFFDSRNLRNQSVLRHLLEETGKPAPHAGASPRASETCEPGCFNPRHYTWHSPNVTNIKRASRPAVALRTEEVLRSAGEPMQFDDIKAKILESSDGLLRSVLRDLVKENKVSTAVIRDGGPGRPATTWQAA